MCSMKHIHTVFIQPDFLNARLCARLQEQRWMTHSALKEFGGEKIA